MTVRPISQILSLVAWLWLSTFLFETQAGVCAILQVFGANQKIGAGFGVATDGSVARSGSGDTGADSTEFEPTQNPQPVCGKVALHGGKAVDVSSYVQKASASDVPSVYSNGSIPLTIFQVNRIGGGPMTCDYSADATGNSWEPMYMTLNIPGNFGLLASQNVHHSAVATFKGGAKLTGGNSGNMGLVRCRAGQQGVCGGCFVVQMDGAMTSTVGTSAAGAAHIKQTVKTVTQGQTQLTSSQMTTVINQVVLAAKSQGLVAS